jgi:hypothetical protein
MKLPDKLPEPPAWLGMILSFLLGLAFALATGLLYDLTH